MHTLTKTHTHTRTQTHTHTLTHTHTHALTHAHSYSDMVAASASCVPYLPQFLGHILELLEDALQLGDHHLHVGPDELSLTGALTGVRRPYWRSPLRHPSQAALGPVAAGGSGGHRARGGARVRARMSRRRRRQRHRDSPQPNYTQTETQRLTSAQLHTDRDTEGATSTPPAHVWRPANSFQSG